MEGGLGRAVSSIVNEEYELTGRRGEVARRQRVIGETMMVVCRMPTASMF